MNHSMTTGMLAFRKGIQGLLVLVVALLLSACERPQMESVQRGYRGTGMVQIYNPTTLKKTLKNMRRLLHCLQATHQALKLRRFTKTSRSWAI